MQANSDNLSRDIEEIWLLRKLGNHKEAQEHILLLRAQYPDHPPLLELAVLEALDLKDYVLAKELTSQLEKVDAQNPALRSFKISIAFAQNDWLEAVRLLEENETTLTMGFDLRKDYAFALTQLKEWSRARKQYELIIDDPKISKDLIWDYRRVLDQAANKAGVSFDYIMAPSSFREYMSKQYFLKRVNSRLSILTEIFEDQYTQKALGLTDGIKENIYAHRFTLNYQANQVLNISTDWQLDYSNGENSSEQGLKADFVWDKQRSSIGYDNNHLVRSPVAGLIKEGHLDRLYLNYEIDLTQRLTLGNSSDIQWFRVNEDNNQINAQSSLGSKYSYDFYGSYRLFNKPYLSANMHYKRGHWDKAFEEADNVLDFTGDERVYYGGLYMETPLGSKFKFTNSITRSFDEKRNFYSTLTNAGLEWWIKNNLKAVVYYEYDRNINGTQGSGNLQEWKFSFNRYF